MIWQRCQVHFQRDAQKQVPAKERGELVRRLKDVFDAPDLKSARQRLEAVIAFYEKRYPRLSGWLEEKGEEALAVFGLPPQHHKRMRSTNGLERFQEELARRTHVVGIFPNEDSCLRLTSALAMEQSEKWMAGPIYLDMNLLEDWDFAPQSAQLQEVTD